jgi:serine/threonine-protein kinase
MTVLRARTLEHTPLAPGFVLGGRLRLVRPIAAGGMGEVWVAINEATGAEIAAKIWRPGDARSRAMAASSGIGTRERFTHEAQLGAKLAHRSIVKIFDLLKEPDGTLVLMMELLRGETIEHRIASQGPMSAREAVAAVVPILSALQHAHEMGVVHRDVKPANIFLHVDPDGTTTPKLVDFGIAKVPAAGNHTVDGHVLGTPRYMSPEHIRGKLDLDGRSDLFSVATVLYEMLTGRPPFSGTTPAATLAAVLEHEVDPDPHIDGRLWKEVARALAKRPYERHRTAAELAMALCNAVGATETELAAALPKVKPPAPAFDLGSADLASEVPSRSQARPTLRTRRQRAVWITIGVGVASVLVLLAAMSAKSGKSESPSAAGATAATATAAPSVLVAAPSAIATASAPAPSAADVAPAASEITPRPAPARTAAATVARPRGAPAAPRGVATRPGF